jgi:Ser/Thr protein kinase RdoA (MazF antagonist)
VGDPKAIVRRGADLQAVLALLPAPVSEIEQLGGPGRPWSVRYGAGRAVLRRNDPSRFRDFGQSEDVALGSITWLHELLRDLAQLGFAAPVPINDLEGRSIAVVDGALWELLAHVPGRPMGWTDREMHAAGALLARFHEASLALPTRAQRPGAQPPRECRPSHPAARAVRVAFERELEDVAVDSAPRGVIHGDATQSNVVIEDSGDYHLVDFAIAYQDAFLADIASALWRNGRASPNAVTYEASRAARFVRGYATVRPLTPSAGRAIVIHMKGRGLQLQWRLEQRRGGDETIVQRLLAIEAQQAQLGAAIIAALDVSAPR